ncbi:hypothetical protein RUM44_002220 [Polyplax serrata]|uniref:Uncharacterized protein n=1 Tax=Polyplax serrata TaxID=468196 RepID=A0ABR1AMA7_POLSC
MLNGNASVHDLEWEITMQLSNDFDKVPYGAPQPQSKGTLNLPPFIVPPGETGDWRETCNSQEAFRECATGGGFHAFERSLGKQQRESKIIEQVELLAARGWAVPQPRVLSHPPRPAAPIHLESAPVNHPTALPQGSSHTPLAPELGGKDKGNVSGGRIAEMKREKDRTAGAEAAAAAVGTERQQEDNRRRRGSRNRVGVDRLDVSSLRRGMRIHQGVGDLRKGKKAHFRVILFSRMNYTQV